VLNRIFALGRLKGVDAGAETAIDHARELEQIERRVMIARNLRREFHHFELCGNLPGILRHADAVDDLLAENVRGHAAAFCGRKRW